MRMYDVKALAGLPPSSDCKPELIDPAWASEWQRYVVVSDARELVRNLLCKHMDLVLLGQLLHQRNRIAFSATSSGLKQAIQNSDTQSFRSRIIRHRSWCFQAQGSHTLRLSS